jgi:hypothetical protein
MFLPRILLTPGRWFVEQYPEEISVIGNLIVVNGRGRIRGWRV